MANAVFTLSESSAYDDIAEERYHFPRTYLRQVEQAVGDWIVYYEPRRIRGSSDSSGRQAYFAIARVLRVRPDAARAEHFYADVEGYLEFDDAVPFRIGDQTLEPILTKLDGSTNKGAFGRAVRLLPPAAFELIVRLGLRREADPWDRLHSAAAEEASEFPERPLVIQLLERPFRDRAFRRHVREAYRDTCAVSGLRLINGGGRPEVRAAHIVPVEESGPDSVRNGLALTGTVHWMFARGFISVSDGYEILVADGAVPEELRRLVPAGRHLRLPARPEWRPHPKYLQWHRRNRFKG